MKCSYGCDYEPTSLTDAAQHAAQMHAEAKAARRAESAAARAAAAGANPRSAGGSRGPKPGGRTPPAGPASAAPPAGEPDLEATGPADLGGLLDTGERPPASPDRPGWRERMWGGGSKRATSSSSAPPMRPSKEKRPKVPARRRVSTAKLLGGAWGAAGMGLVRFGVDEPVGRVMAFQGPAAGDILEGLTKGTALDRPLQYLAGRADDVQAAVGLFELPLLVLMYQRASEDLARAIEPMLVAAIKRNFVAMVPVVRKQREEERQWREAVKELGLEGDDPVRDLLASIFAPAPTAAEETAHPDASAA